MTTVLVAPCGFKENLSADEVADAIAEGIADASPATRVLKAPIPDGGEGFVAALVRATQGSLHPVTVTGPLGAPVQAAFGFLGGTPAKRTAVVEVAAAAGLRLVSADAREPERTTSYGVGELIRAALDAGAERIVIGCGDSAISDGGAGMAEALGIRFLEADGRPIGRGGAALLRLTRIDASGRDSRLERVVLDAAVNWHNVLLGPAGVTRVFGPQKGATAEQVITLEAALSVFADKLRALTGRSIHSVPGGGASGGVGAALSELLGAKLWPRYDLVMAYTPFDQMLPCADLVITAEGKLDGQTPLGKVPAEVARRAKAHGLPVLALAAALDSQAGTVLDCGIDAFSSIQEAPCTPADSMTHARELVRRAAARMMRIFSVGLAAAKRHEAASDGAESAVARNPMGDPHRAVIRGAAGRPCPLRSSPSRKLDRDPAARGPWRRGPILQ